MFLPEDRRPWDVVSRVPGVFCWESGPSDPDSGSVEARIGEPGQPGLLCGLFGERR